MPAIGDISPSASPWGTANLSHFKAVNEGPKSGAPFCLGNVHNQGGSGRDLEYQI
ncbi:hypothetical protein EDF59_12927 [Novosphingobium sp. ST904]|nr:hypothetical protein EDF59_12927 [Novosphingobium sp. ST904]